MYNVCIIEIVPGLINPKIGIVLLKTSLKCLLGLSYVYFEHGWFILVNSILSSQRRRTETKPDTYSKDRIFVTSFAFCVITYEPIEVQTCSAPQNDRQNLVFVKDIKVVVEKMTRNRRKVIGKPGDSLLCRLHSIQLSSLGILFSMPKLEGLWEVNLWLVHDRIFSILAAQPGPSGRLSCLHT
jgi:hypothetical protein